MLNRPSLDCSTLNESMSLGLRVVGKDLPPPQTGDLRGEEQDRESSLVEVSHERQFLGGFEERFPVHALRPQAVLVALRPRLVSAALKTNLHLGRELVAHQQVAVDEQGAAADRNATAVDVIRVLRRVLKAGPSGFRVVNRMFLWSLPMD